MKQGSKSLITQDLVLLSDFVPFSEVIQMLMKGTIQFSNNDALSFMEELLSPQQVDQVFTNFGKNEIDLLREPHAMPGDLVKLGTKGLFELSSCLSKDAVIKPTQGGYVDQDLFTVIILCSLFDGDKFHQYDCSVNKNLRVLQIDFEETIDSQGVNTFSSIEPSIISALSRKTKTKAARITSDASQKRENY